MSPLWLLGISAPWKHWEVGAQGLPLCFTLRQPHEKDAITDIFQSSPKAIFSDLATSVSPACTLHCPPLLQTATLPQFRCITAKFNLTPSLLSPSYLALASDKPTLSNFDILIAFGRFPFQCTLTVAVKPFQWLINAFTCPLSLCSKICFSEKSTFVWIAGNHWQRTCPFLNSTKQAKFNVSYTALNHLGDFQTIVWLLLIIICISVAHCLRDIAFC